MKEVKLHLLIRIKLEKCNSEEVKLENIEYNIYLMFKNKKTMLYAVYGYSIITDIIIIKPIMGMLYTLSFRGRIKGMWLERGT